MIFSMLVAPGRSRTLELWGRVWSPDLGRALRVRQIGRKLHIAYIPPSKRHGQNVTPSLLRAMIAQIV